MPGHLAKEIGYILIRGLKEQILQSFRRSHKTCLTNRTVEVEAHNSASPQIVVGNEFLSDPCRTDQFLANILKKEATDLYTRRAELGCIALWQTGCIHYIPNPLVTMHSCTACMAYAPMVSRYPWSTASPPRKRSEPI
ncbi:hypothetical protein OSTOST_05876 [Ostertagia ostertagi]